MKIANKLFMTLLSASISYLISIILFIFLVFLILGYKRIESRSYELMNQWHHVQLGYNEIMLSMKSIEVIRESWIKSVDIFDASIKEFSGLRIKPFFSDDVREKRERIARLWNMRIKYFVINLRLNLEDLGRSEQIKDVMNEGQISLIQLYMNSKMEHIALTENEKHSIERFIQNYYLLGYSGVLQEKNLLALNRDIKEQSNRLIVIILVFISLLSIFMLFATFILVTAIGRSFTQKVKKIERTVFDVSKGDFSAGLGFTSKDEFGILSRNFDIFITSLRNNLDSLHDFTKHVDYSLISGADFGSLLDKLTGLIKKAVQADTVCLYTVDLHKKQLCEQSSRGGKVNPFLIAASIGSREEELITRYEKSNCTHPAGEGERHGLSIPFEYQDTLFARVIQEEKALFLKRTQQKQISSIILAPIFISGDLWGVIALLKGQAEIPFYDLNYIHAKTFAEYTGLAVDNYYKVLMQVDKTRLQKEMEVARTIQTSLLPPDFVHPELEVCSKMITADQVGGDYYDIMTDRQNDLWFAIGDVSGHGITAGLIMMMAQTSFLSSLDILEGITPREAVVNINSILFENINKRMNAPYCMTMTLLKYCGQGTFLHAGAHLDLIIYRNRSRTCELVGTQGCFLGFIPDISEVTRNLSFTLEPGDILLLCTDGLTEARHKKSRELFGEKRLARMLAEYAALDLDDIKKNLFENILDWSRGLISDDLTLMLIKRKI